MSPKIIYLIDDDPIYQIITKKIIQKTTVATAIFSFSNGSEAIEGLISRLHKPEELPDIILLDINMPIKDGWDFMEAFKRIQQMFTKKTLIYIVSSSIAISDKEKAKTYKEISGFLTKPFSAQDFLEIIKASENH